MEKKQEMEEPVTNFEKENNKPLIHDFNSQSLKSAFTPKVLALMVLVIIFGLFSGYFISGRTSSTSSTKDLGTILSGSSASKGTIVGSNDTKTFKDIAQGQLKTGGIDGEGAYHLERSGGESQNVYLTSSIVDLSKYVGKKLKVWGQTQKAKTAGWLMDVGRIEVL